MSQNSHKSQNTSYFSDTLTRMADGVVTALTSHIVSEVALRSRGAVNKVESELNFAENLVDDVESHLGEPDQSSEQGMTGLARDALSEVRKLVPQPDELKMQRKLKSFIYANPATSALVGGACIFAAIKLSSGQSIK